MSSLFQIESFVEGVLEYRRPHIFNRTIPNLLGNDIHHAARLHSVQQYYYRFRPEELPHLAPATEGVEGIVEGSSASR